MSLDVGSRLGHYDVTALIGEGGMGQVPRSHEGSMLRLFCVTGHYERCSADHVSVEVGR